MNKYAYIVDNLICALKVVKENPLATINYKKFNFLDTKNPITLFGLLSINDYFYFLGLNLDDYVDTQSDRLEIKQYFKTKLASETSSRLALDRIFGIKSDQLLNRNLCMPNLMPNIRVFDLTVRLIEDRIKKYKLLMARIKDE